MVMTEEHTQPNPETSERETIAFAHLQHKIFFVDMAAAYDRSSPQNVVHC